jgi:hypothetical protein
MIDRVGAARLMRDGNAQKLDSSDFGTLWRLDLAGDEDGTIRLDKGLLESMIADIESKRVRPK